MNKRIFTLILACVMVMRCFFVFDAEAKAATVKSGTGTSEPKMENEAYQIGTAEELLWFAEAVNGGNTAISGVLTKDIDLSGKNWPGIGTNSNKFAGSFDGQGHVVTFQNASSGLFGYIMGSSGALASVENVITAGSVKRSAIADRAGYAAFTDCINRATVTANVSYVGGIVGKAIGVNKSGYEYSDLRFTRCGNEASITGISNLGGLIGWSQTELKMTECYNTGNINGYDNVGGLAGYLQGSTGSALVKYCYNTGRVTGTGCVGGIVGLMYNSTTVSWCYNAGYAVYAIAGTRFNQTSRISDSFFLATASSKCSPDYNLDTRYDETTNEIQTRAQAVSGAEMADEDFAELLGTAFVQSCPTPVFAWQNPVEHTGEVCENCMLGSTEKEVYDVTFQQDNGYTIQGDDKVTQGSAYSFTIAISEGYEAAAGFTVKVNGNVVTPASNGTYTVLHVSGPLSVTVRNVQLIPGSHSIVLPGAGYGYRATGEKTVKRDADYTFTLTFVDGFKAGPDFTVTALEDLSQSELDKGTIPTEVVLTGKDGIYTLPCVQKNYKIQVSGVEAVSKADPVTVNLTITSGYYEFHEPNDSGEVIIDRSLTVPYFDLSVYGLQRYYYNPYCYLDEDGKIRNTQQKGTPESAYDQITVMHAFIVATEVFYLGYSPEEAGSGLSYRQDPEGFNKVISWSQDAGSSFMKFWDHGTNLNYYVNYAYPLAYAGWGSTSDQILIENGDVLSIHMITGQGSGSNFGFFTVNDTDSRFDAASDVYDSWTANQGEKVKLTHYWTVTAGNYSTSHKVQANRQLYWIAADDLTGNESDIRTWNTSDFGKTTADQLITDANGKVTINTTGVEPGTYYFATVGGFTEGGGKDDAGFTSAGNEAGASFFRLTVNEYNGRIGDVDNDTEITAKDATMLLTYVAGTITGLNEGMADVDADGVVTAKDATMILTYVAGTITSFPAEE